MTVNKLLDLLDKIHRDAASKAFADNPTEDNAIEAIDAQFVASYIRSIDLPVDTYNRVELIDHSKPHFAGVGGGAGHYPGFGGGGGGVDSNYPNGSGVGGRVTAIRGDLEVDLLEQDDGETLKIVVQKLKMSE